MTFEIKYQTIEKSMAVNFCRKHHSRLPNTQKGPWLFAFGAFFREELVSAALWHNTSARGLPKDWIELRRLASSPDMPKGMTSQFLSYMISVLRKLKLYTMAISYQDVQVHCGTIYKASNWKPTYFSKPRIRNRLPKRTGTNRAYRSDINGTSTASSGKIRWQIWLSKKGKNELNKTPSINTNLCINKTPTK